MEWLAGAMFGYGLVEVWIGWRLRQRAWVLADECDRGMGMIRSEVERLGKLSEALSLEQASNLAVLNEFVATWNDGDQQAAVDLLQRNGFRVVS